MKQKETIDSVLAKKILARQKFVKQLIDFAELAVREGGTVLDCQEHNSHTYINAKLENFANFSFQARGSFSMFGGNSVTIWHCQDRKIGEPKLVFDASHWSG